MLSVENQKDESTENNMKKDDSSEKKTIDDPFEKAFEISEVEDTKKATEKNSQIDQSSCKR